MSKIQIQSLDIGYRKRIVAMLKKLGIIGLLTFILLAGPMTGTAWAQEAVENPINTGDTAFMLISAALVLFMTPGLAFFYGGLVRSRNVLNTMMMSFILMGIVGVTWVFWGYSLAFDVSTPVSEGFWQRHGTVYWRIRLGIFK